MDKLELKSPAKINLFFRILNKRSDGYHEIESVYQAIDLFDRLFFSFSSSDEISCTDPTIPVDETNLIFKALKMFREKCDLPPIQIHLEKNIPVQAGLGGGSSNAATTLLGLNELMNFPLKKVELIELGKKIGSDVPFFFSNGTALCTGRGEIISPFEFQKLNGFIAKPFFGLSTPLVYNHVRLEKLPKRTPDFHFYNDLEIPAFTIEPRLVDLKCELEKSFSQVIMTGSGTAFFCLNGTAKPIENVSYFPFKSIKLFS